MFLNTSIQRPADLNVFMFIVVDIQWSWSGSLPSHSPGSCTEPPSANAARTQRQWKHQSCITHKSTSDTCYVVWDSCWTMLTVGRNLMLSKLYIYTFLYIRRLPINPRETNVVSQNRQTSISACSVSLRERYKQLFNLLLCCEHINNIYHNS